MVAMSGEKERGAQGGGRFHTTHWSVVLAAGDRESTDRRQALSTLCETYWYPIYAYARRRGLSPERAQDTTQGFFVHLLEREGLQHAKPEKGRFRSFLAVSFRNFLSDGEGLDPATYRPLCTRRSQVCESRGEL